MTQLTRRQQELLDWITEHGYYQFNGFHSFGYPRFAERTCWALVDAGLAHWEQKSSQGYHVRYYDYLKPGPKVG